jgi:hypothetical protein
MILNAIDGDGVQFNAGQICTEDDQAMRELLVLNEYKPVLETCELTWHGTRSSQRNDCDRLANWDMVIDFRGWHKVIGAIVRDNPTFEQRTRNC